MYELAVTTPPIPYLYNVPVGSLLLSIRLYLLYFKLIRAYRRRRDAAYL
jgi:hypothetical protein